MTVLTERSMTVESGARREPRWLPAALTGVVVLPILTAIARAVHQRWFPIGDDALLFLRTRDVLTANHPLLGSWSSASLSLGHDVNNPGPLYSDLIAPFGKLLPGGSGAAIGVGLVNIAAVVAISLAARAIGGWRFQRVMLVAAGLLVWTMGSWLVIDIWQPHALLLPFMLLVVLLIGIAVGRSWCVVATVGVGSLIVQTHIAYAYVFAVLLVATAVLALVRRGSGRNLPWRSALTGRVARWSYALAAVLWSQTLFEQFFGSGEGNLSRLASGAGGGDLTVGARDATRLTAAVLFQAPWAMRSGFTTAVPRTPVTQTDSGPTLVIQGIHGVAVAGVLVVVALAVVVTLTIVHRRAGDQLLAIACGMATAGVLAGVGCIALVTVGPVGLGQHHVRWLWPMAILVQVIVVWGVVAIVARHRPAVDRLATPAVVAVVVVLAIAALQSYVQPEGPTADRADMPALRQVFAQLDVLHDSAPVVFDLSNVRPYEAYSSAVMMRLQELGIDFRVTEAPMLRQLGDRRRATGSEQTTIFQLEGFDVALYDGDACRVAIGSALSRADGEAAEATAHRLAEALSSGDLDVDDAALNPDDATRLDAARDGDATDAMQIVIDGTLARWIAAGTATISPDDAAALEQIAEWGDTVYAVYATNPTTCPPAA